MLLPANFKQTIAEHFYDKTIKVLESTETNTNGWVEHTLTEKGTFQGNVQFNNLGEVQSELGITESVDIAITCGTSVDVAGEDLLEYLGQKYAVTAIRPSDSHLLITGRKWA